jgi:hypothetical protein
VPLVCDAPVVPGPVVHRRLAEVQSGGVLGGSHDLVHVRQLPVFVPMDREPGFQVLWYAPRGKSQQMKTSEMDEWN